MKVENDLEPPVDWQHERASAVALGIHSFIGSLIVFMKLNIAIIVQYISDPHPLSSDYLIYQPQASSSHPFRTVHIAVSPSFYGRKLQKSQALVEISTSTMFALIP